MRMNLNHLIEHQSEVEFETAVPIVTNVLVILDFLLSIATEKILTQ